MIDYNSKELKNRFTDKKKADKLAHKLEMIFGPFIFIGAMAVWGLFFVMMGV